MPEVHGIKGGAPILRLEKQVIKPLNILRPLDVPTESKGHFQAKVRVGQDRTGIKRKIPQKCPLSQLHEKAKQPKLLPGRKPIMQIVERPTSQQSRIIIQPKIKCQALVIQNISDRKIRRTCRLCRFYKPKVKPLIEEIIQEHVKQVPSTENVIPKAISKISRKEIRQEKTPELQIIVKVFAQASRHR